MGGGGAGDEPAPAHDGDRAAAHRDPVAEQEVASPADSGAVSRAFQVTNVVADRILR